MPALFTVLTGAAAPLIRDNIDAMTLAPRTPAEKGGAKTQGGAETVVPENLMTGLRFDEHGAERPDFVLNRPEFRAAKFLIAGKNFGCGSAREHAVWALVSFGIRCVIAPSFGPLFYSNCFKNGVVPVALDARQIATMADEAAPGAPNAIFSLDVAAQKLTTPSGKTVDFQVPGFRLQQLLEGLDEIEMTLRHKAAIAAFHENGKQRRPWIYS